MNCQNMLGAKKVKLHGMTSSKWTTKDKLIQYKGLINLYTRDRKIIDVDTIVSGKKLVRELKSVQKSVDADRKKLDNAIRGDKQQLRNTLSEHKELQMAYQNSQPQKVIECVYQVNFNTRKVLDRLDYEMRLRSNTLIDLKIKQSELEDRIKYPDLGKLSVEIGKAELITGAVQDAILKKEAALSIRHSYAKIIDIMKRDSLYFDAILLTMGNDNMAQSKCLINATKLGQLATEYLDDRRQEYDNLEAVVLKDMKARKADLVMAKQQAKQASAGIKQLLRRDSDCNTCVIDVKETPSDQRLKDDLQVVDNSLKFLQSQTFVTSYEAIYPTLVEQMRQKGRLTAMARRCEKKRDIIMNKLDHAELMNNMLSNTMVETTGDYKMRKRELLVQTHEKQTNIKHLEEVIKTKIKLKAEIRMVLRQLLQMAKIIRTDNEARDRFDKNIKVDVYGTRNAGEALTEPEVDEIDGTVILPMLIKKFTFLMTKYDAGKFDDKDMNEAYAMFEATMLERSLPRSDEIRRQASLLQGLVSEISHTLTREDIKKMSREIVEANTKNEDLEPMFKAPPKHKKFKR